LYNIFDKFVINISNGLTVISTLALQRFEKYKKNVGKLKKNVKKALYIYIFRTFINVYFNHDFFCNKIN